jgi:hypothetical protein
MNTPRLAMSDEPWYSPKAKPPPPPKPTPGELVWSLVKGDRVESAELRTHAEAGVELQLLMDGELFLGQRFATRALALAEAAMFRVLLEAEGWTEKGGA